MSTPQTCPAFPAVLSRPGAGHRVHQPEGGDHQRVADLADACGFLMRNYDDPDIINIGTGKDMTIKELAETVARVIGFEGNFRFDTSKPDGTPVKCLDVSRLNDLGWHAKIGLEDGIKETYNWYVSSISGA